MKKIIILIFIILNFNVHAEETDYSCGKGSDSANVSDPGTCSYDFDVNEYYVYGYYATEQEAIDARQSAKASIRAMNPGYNGEYDGGSDGVCGLFGCNGDIWRSYGYYIWKCTSSGTNFNKRYYFMFIKDTWIDEDENCISDDDNDNDGQPDNQDISPDDDNCPEWQKKLEITNVAGTCTYFLRIITEEGKYFDFGNAGIMNDALAGNVDVTINDYPMPYYDKELGKFNIKSGLDCNDIPSINLCDSAPVQKTEYNESYPDPKQTTVQNGDYEGGKDLEDGNDNTGNSTETDYLADIVQNTKNSNTNEQHLSDQLKDINNNLIQNRESLKEELSIWENDNRVQNEISNSKQVLAQRDATSNDGKGDYSIDADDITKEDINDYDDLIDGFLNLPIIKDTEVTISEPVCSFTVDLEIMNVQKTITFSFCEYEDWLDSFGTLILMIASFNFVIIILKQ